MAEWLVESVPQASLPFVLTVWLGDRNRMERGARTDFVESGTAHILAVSGVQQVYRTDYGGSIRVSREDGKLKISGAREVKNIAIR